MPTKLAEQTTEVTVAQPLAALLSRKPTLLGRDRASPMAFADLLATVDRTDRGMLEALASRALDHGEETGRLLVRLDFGDSDPIQAICVVAAPGGRLRVELDLDDAAAARRAETHIRQVVEGAQQAAVVRIDNRSVYTNPALARLLGFESLEALRATGGSSNFVHPDDQELVRQRADRRVDGKPVPDHYEFRMLRTDGSVIWVECFVSRITWNDQPASLAWLLDITERKQSELALKRSEELFMTLFQASPAMLAISRIDDGRIMDVNDNWLSVLGYERISVIGRTERELGLLGSHSEGRRILTNARQGVEQSETIVNARTRSGASRQIAIFGQIVRFDDQQMLLTVGRDVTDRQREEEELRESKAAAEFANRAKSEFLANTSHELRTPLNAIIGFSEAIRGEMMGPIGTPKYLEYADDIRESGMLLLDVINDLLDLSKLEAGKQELQESVVSIQRLVGSTVRLVHERATSANIRLITDLSENLPDLKADDRLLKQVLMNLLSNAVKFTNSGGRVTVGARRLRTGAVEIWVSDTGIGMSAEELEIALTPFGQVQNPMTSKHPGTGLGLPIVRSLCELHGARMDIRSRPDQGTRIALRFPSERSLHPGAEAEAAPLPTLGGEDKIEQVA